MSTGTHEAVVSRSCVLRRKWKGCPVAEPDRTLCPFDPSRRSGRGSSASGGGGSGTGPPLLLQTLIRLRHRRIQVGLAAQAENYRIARLDVGAVPVHSLRFFLEFVSFPLLSSLPTWASERRGKSRSRKAMASGRSSRLATGVPGNVQAPRAPAVRGGEELGGGPFELASHRADIRQHVDLAGWRPGRSRQCLVSFAVSGDRLHLQRMTGRRNPRSARRLRAVF